MDRPVFVSYSRANTEFAEMLIHALKSEGFSIWWDKDLEGATRWPDELDRRLQLAGCVVVIWSPHSAGSEWVLAEAEYGFAEKKLVPVFLDECEIPNHLADLQMFDLSAWQGGIGYGTFQKLTKAIQRDIEMTEGLDDVGVLADEFEQFFVGESLADIIGLAEDGDLDAMNHLGQGYTHGFGDLNVDEERAVEWLQAAADGGHAEAACHLGDHFHSSGEFDTAKRWYERAAEGGYGMGAYQLGRMYAFGEGVRLNPKMAYRWLERAEELGEGDATENYDRLIG